MFSALASYIEYNVRCIPSVYHLKYMVRSFTYFVLFSLTFKAEYVIDITTVDDFIYKKTVCTVTINDQSIHHNTRDETYKTR